MEEEENITSKLAISNINFEKVSIGWIMNIFEKILNKKIISVKKYISESQKEFAIAEFESTADSKIIYDFCDEIEIEDTKERFSLSFVPQTLILGEPTEAFTASESFKYFQKMRKKKKQEEKDIEYKIEMSNEEENIESENKEMVDLKTELKSKQEIKSKAIEKLEQQSLMHDELKKKEKTKETEGFELNIHDCRFGKLFSDENFTIDASNEKYKAQPLLNTVLKEIRKKYKFD